MSFSDADNNGQVNVDLETNSKKIPCRDMNLQIKGKLKVNRIMNCFKAMHCFGE